MLSESEELEKSFGDRWHRGSLAWIVLIISLLITAMAFYYSSKVTEERAEERFQFRTDEIVKSIEDRMHIYEQVLQGGVGLFNASEHVDRNEFAQYVSALNIELHWPGIQGIGYSVPVSAAEKDHHESLVRQQGFSDYSIKPEGERESYTAIIYLEPFDWRNKRAFGYDMWSNDMRRSAMMRARDEGVSATSGVITLVQETKENAQKGFLTYLPVYKKNEPLKTVEDRRAAFMGWVYSPFRAGDLMAGILTSKELDYEFIIYDGLEVNQDSFLFASHTESLKENKEDRKYSRWVSLTLQGRPWTIWVSTRDPQDSFLPQLIGVSGVIIDLLLFCVILSLHGGKRKAVDLAKEMNLELHEQKEVLEKSNRDLEQFALIASHDLKEPLASNERYASFLNDEYPVGVVIDDGAVKALSVLSKNSMRMRSLLKGLTQYASVNHIKLTKTKVELHELLMELTESLNMDVRGAKLVIHGMLPSMVSHESYCLQIFQNLVDNAIKYNISDEKVVEVWHERTDKGDVYFVRDNGIGIPDHHHEKVFDIFSRLNINEQFGEGAGAGLTIVQRMVHFLGGEIWIEKSDDKGTTFAFTLMTDAGDA